jgi:thiol-disulfide isomerase/thioredoxin
MRILIGLILALFISATASAKVVEVKNLPGLIKTLEAGPAVVMFTADWCPGCKIFHSVYEQLSTQITIPFLSIDMDNPDLLPLTAGIPQIPTVVVLAVKKDAGGTRILGCLTNAPNAAEAVKTSILQCLVEVQK